MCRIYYILFIYTALLTSCSSDKPSLLDEQPVESSNIYLEFNKWVYSQMNRQYLWREDLPDSVDCNYDLSPKEFFKSLLSSKDRFSYFTFNSNYSKVNKRNKSPFAYQLYSDKQGNEAMCVLYVNSSSASEAGLRRGDFVKYQDVTGNCISLKQMEYKDNVFIEKNKTFEFVIDDSSESSTVLIDSIYNIGNKNIGYLCYLEYGDANDLIEPIKKFKNNAISDLILDLRYNPGGYVSTCKYLCNCIIPSNGYGATFQQCSYNDILTKYYEQTTGNGRTYSNFEYPADNDKEVLGAAILGLNLKRLFVITSRNTASASEATIVCLNPYMDVITIGETTIGKGVGSWTISDNRYQYAIQPITMRYYNANGYSTPDSGIVPDYYIADGYSTKIKDLGDIEEPLLKQSLQLILPDYFKPSKKSESDSKENVYLKPIGVPSFVQEFNKKNQLYED